MVAPVFGATGHVSENVSPPKVECLDRFVTVAEWHLNFVIRGQANTAKLLANSPTLMRLRELEVLEMIASAGKLNIVLGEKSLGEKGLADKVVNLQ